MSEFYYVTFSDSNLPRILSYEEIESLGTNRKV